jgi:hypothetical protein
VSNSSKGEKEWLEDMADSVGEMIVVRKKG